MNTGDPAGFVESTRRTTPVPSGLDPLARQQIGSTLRGDYLNAQSGPTRDFIQANVDERLPGLLGRLSQRGTLDSTVTASLASEQIAQEAAKLANAERNRQIQAAGMLPRVVGQESLNRDPYFENVLAQLLGAGMIGSSLLGEGGLGNLTNAAGGLLRRIPGFGAEATSDNTLFGDFFAPGEVVPTSDNTLFGDFFAGGAPASSFNPGYAPNVGIEATFGPGISGSGAAPGGIPGMDFFGGNPATTPAFDPNMTGLSAGDAGGGGFFDGLFDAGGFFGGDPGTSIAGGLQSLFSGGGGFAASPAFGLLGAGAFPAFMLAESLLESPGGARNPLTGAATFPGDPVPVPIDPVTGTAGLADENFARATGMLGVMDASGRIVQMFPGTPADAGFTPGGQQIVFLGDANFGANTVMDPTGTAQQAFISPGELANIVGPAPDIFSGPQPGEWIGREGDFVFDAFGNRQLDPGYQLLPA